MILHSTPKIFQGMVNHGASTIILNHTKESALKTRLIQMGEGPTIRKPILINAALASLQKMTGDATDYGIVAGRTGLQVSGVDLRLTHLQIHTQLLSLFGRDRNHEGSTAIAALGAVDPRGDRGFNRFHPCIQSDFVYRPRLRQEQGILCLTRFRLRSNPGKVDGIGVRQ